MFKYTKQDGRQWTSHRNSEYQNCVSATLYKNQLYMILLHTNKNSFLPQNEPGTLLHTQICQTFSILQSHAQLAHILYNTHTTAPILNIIPIVHILKTTLLWASVLWTCSLRFHIQILWAKSTKFTQTFVFPSTMKWNNTAKIKY